MDFLKELKDLALGHVVFVTMVSLLGIGLRRVFGAPRGDLPSLLQAEHLACWLPAKIRKDVLADLADQFAAWSSRFGAVRARRLCLWWLLLAAGGWLSPRFGGCGTVGLVKHDCILVI